MGQELRRQLLDLRERDHAKRQELVERGELHLGYHPEMERVHEVNATVLEQVLERQAEILAWARRVGWVPD